VVQVVAERGEVGHSEHFARVRLTTPHPVGAVAAVTVTGADAAGLEAG
jgi:hypothetical protein